MSDVQHHLTTLSSPPAISKELLLLLLGNSALDIINPSPSFATTSLMSGDIKLRTFTYSYILKTSSPLSPIFNLDSVRNIDINGSTNPSSIIITTTTPATNEATKDIPPQSTGVDVRVCMLAESKSPLINEPRPEESKTEFSRTGEATTKPVLIEGGRAPRTPPRRGADRLKFERVPASPTSADDDGDLQGESLDASNVSIPGGSGGGSGGGGGGGKKESLEDEISTSTAVGAEVLDVAHSSSPQKPTQFEHGLEPNSTKIVRYVSS